MHKLIKEHGKEVMKEIIDYVMIEGQRKDWREFALRHDFIKKTTKTVSVRLHHGRKSGEWYNDENGNMQRREFGRTIKFYRVSLLNGRGSTVKSWSFHELDIEQILEELS